MAPEYHRIKRGLLLFGAPVEANYRLLRAYANNKPEALAKAVLARCAIPVYLDPEYSFMVALWIWLRTFL